MDASFRPTLSQRVAYERAWLAREDPEGEKDAIPVNVDKLLTLEAMSELEQLRWRMDKLMREAALAGDWELWERIKVERWPNGYGKDG